MLTSTNKNGNADGVHCVVDVYAPGGGRCSGHFPSLPVFAYLADPQDSNIWTFRSNSILNTDLIIIKIMTSMTMIMILFVLFLYPHVLLINIIIILCFRLANMFKLEGDTQPYTTTHKSEFRVLHTLRVRVSRKGIVGLLEGLTGVGGCMEGGHRGYAVGC
jgi:hypothetical protein